MINVSTEFKNTMQYRRDFFYTCTITFNNGTSVDLQTNDFVVSGNGIVSGAGTSSFAIGNAICKQLTLVIRNDYDQYYDYDFYNAVIQLYLNFALSENTEIINLGKYTVREPETYGSTITLTAMDDMYKTDVPLSQTNFPKTVLQGLLDSCSKCGLSLLTTSFKNSDFVINKPGEGTTERQFIGMCAMIAGGNAVVDEYGRLKIITYDLSLFETLGNYDGGIFDNGTPYESGDDVDGGNFYPWDYSNITDGGTFKDQDKYHVFNKIQNCTISTDDVVITGVKITNNDTTYFYGTEGYVLELENQIVSGKETDALKAIGDLVIGLRFRPFTIDHICYPMAEIGDPCYIVDRKERVYQSVITDIDFSLRGFTVIKCSADSPQRNSSTYNSNAETRAVINARNETQRQISEYDVAVQTLTGIMANSLGMFTTTEQAETGGVIVYQHNKPLLSESDIIWKKTENAFTVSTDGGETWNAGIDADGNAVVNVLSAIGILFDWAKGGTLTLGGIDNKSGIARILDENGNIVGILDKNGLTFTSGGRKAIINNGYTSYAYVGDDGETQIGKIGSAQFKDESYDAYPYGLMFELEDNCNFAAWAAKNPSTGNYIPKFSYAAKKTGSMSKNSLNCKMDMHGYSFENYNFPNAITTTFKVIADIAYNNLGSGTSMYKVKYATISVTNGVITGVSIDSGYSNMSVYIG